MSENLAGITLLALGNGSPDVITSIIASYSDNGGLSMATSSLAGSCLINSFFLAPIVILISKKQISLPAKSYITNMIFLITTLSTIFIFFIVGKICWYTAPILPAIYIAYVVTTLVQELLLKKEETMQIERINPSRSTITSDKFEIERSKDETVVKCDTSELISMMEPVLNEPDATISERDHIPVNTITVPASSNLSIYVKNRLWRNKNIIYVDEYLIIKELAKNHLRKKSEV